MTLQENSEPWFKHKAILQQLLFVSCLLFIFALPVIPNMKPWMAILVLTGIVAFSLLAIERTNKRIFITGMSAIAAGWLAKAIDHMYLTLLSEMVMYVFLLWIVSTLISQIMRLNEVTLYHLLEAVNGYLLLGILFTNFVLFLDRHYPTSFSGQKNPLEKIDLVYYTIVTMTTTGYGDIVPKTHMAKELALIIAVSGQFYVAIIVAILVGKYSNRK